MRLLISVIVILLGLLLGIPFLAKAQTQPQPAKPATQNPAQMIDPTKIRQLENSGKVQKVNPKNWQTQSDIRLNTDEAKFSINAYKIDYLGSASSGEIATLNLYTSGKDNKFAILHFYAADNPLAYQAANLQTDLLHVYYPWDAFEDINTICRTSQRLFLIYNSSVNTAYITTDVNNSIRP
ncbi:MAG: hypothetical protein IPI59_01560 [Sphingobacteriales bacterium]|jgi:hypothetical protein|nr:hypothetical protein [Sphingobacteriales bacterium]MBP9142129.1 hypothetical protein [Chitinophagales bacterium]MDA0198641.1 hypothetical protein [Bacteroidota bacterium]MBK6890690.1 hypothetical protein [Sphingobacteriales bacterium]MBK7526257.1 hypothetical protein [Sphingobacteriales bacterium]